MDDTNTYFLDIRPAALLEKRPAALIDNRLAALLDERPASLVDKRLIDMKDMDCADSNSSDQRDERELRSNRVISSDMIRAIFLVAILLIPWTVGAQFEIRTNYNFHWEGTTKTSRDYTPNRFRHHYYSLGVGYNFKGINVYGGLTFTETNKIGYSYYGSSGTYMSGLKSYFYSATIDMSYVGGLVGLYLIFDRNKNNNISLRIGPALQLDFRRKLRAYDHYSSKKTTFGNNIYISKSNDSFETMEAKNVVGMFIWNIAPKINFGQFFLEPAVSFGFMTLRTESEEYTYKSKIVRNSGLFLRTGVTLGVSIGSGDK